MLGIRPVLYALTAATLLHAAACGDRHDGAWSGYAEADYIYVGAPLAGTLTALHVQPGDNVPRGKPLFELESEAERAARDEARARVESARYQAQNTDKGRRPEEVAVPAAQLDQARAQAELSRRDLVRKQELAAKGFIAQAQVDEARTALRQAQDRVAELTATVQVAKLPARPDERAAADAQVNAAQQVLRQAEWREQQKKQLSPADAQVSETFFRPGEFVAAGQPVLALLPPGNIKARFYVPQAQLPSVALGQRVQLRCDGCGGAIEARISRIATQPEYTPPVIYSNSQRAKLVFLVEAKPVPAAATKLRPGQPLDVQPLEARKP
ncbi:HlyD family secretion protein [Ramlibacter albus]|uniref:HlyD family efflux transporter periplasmic adaptor subunit n=1 Tax=Ramlibacter albus TaxID=2079448 RepID=A0A923MA34_9BURK|nr:HlyD family efflux transporter periplasmic adaptor subunit [Ramlibacter albus]MBC5766815.1 HlyD family efflux transporter periplasmic adaptor subunit [Ramlibacter albus]